MAFQVNPYKREAVGNRTVHRKGMTMKFRVEALEKFVVRTVYEGVEARDAVEAERLCREGGVGFDSKEIEEGDEEWLQTVSVTEE